MHWIWSEYGELPEEARHIRVEVFTEEQGFCQEFDDIDSQSYHLLLMDEDQAIGTARIFFDADHTLHIGRVAVRKVRRSGGCGSAVLTACCEKAKQLGAVRAVLGAQCRAMKFYEKNGFAAFGDLYDDEGCPHRMMEKRL